MTSFKIAPPTKDADVSFLDEKLQENRLGHIVKTGDNYVQNEYGNYLVLVYNPERVREAEKVCQAENFFVVMFQADLVVDEEELKRRNV